MNLENFRSGLFCGMGQLDLAIQSTRTQQGRIQYIGTIRCSNHLDHLIAGKTIQLTQEFQHGTLHFPIPALIAPKSFCSNGINLINEQDSTRRSTLLDLCLGQFECVPDQLGAITNEHLYQLRSCQLEEYSIGLVGACPCQQRLPRPGRPMQQHSLGWFDANGIKHIFVSHWQNHRFDQFLDLLISTTNVTVFFCWSLIYFHGLDTRIKLGRKLFQNEIRILVGAHQIAWLEFIRIDQTRHRQENRLTRRCPYHSRTGLARCIHIRRVTRLLFFFFETIFGIGFENFHDIGNEIRKLFVESDFFLIVTNSIPLSSRFMRDALHIGLHDANIVVEQMNSLSQFSNTHVPCFVVFQGFGRFGWSRCRS
mmetsp:Transcript_12381/g.28676  ORF Transcript_12381/g.28676 Transcript_12381/m.28676 type:complete len:366 (-) Transcript_12381:216-1313(-)